MRFVAAVGIPRHMGLCAIAKAAIRSAVALLLRGESRLPPPPHHRSLVVLFLPEALIFSSAADRAPADSPGLPLQARGVL